MVLNFDDRSGIRKCCGAYLHRFSWLGDEQIGALPREWNWLAIEYPDNPQAKLVHFTLGTPCFKDYTDTAMADIWKSTYGRVIDGMGV